MDETVSSPGAEAIANVAASRPAETRYPAAAVPAITGVRISPGDQATLVNISATGLLVESAQRFAPGQRATVHFEGTLTTRQMKARVVRCHVSVINAKGSLQYQTAMAFDEWIALPKDGPRNDWSTASEAEPSVPTTKQGSAHATNRW